MGPLQILSGGDPKIVMLPRPKTRYVQYSVKFDPPKLLLVSHFCCLIFFTHYSISIHAYITFKTLQNKPSILKIIKIDYENKIYTHMSVCKNDNSLHMWGSKNSEPLTRKRDEKPNKMLIAVALCIPFPRIYSLSKEWSEISCRVNLPLNYESSTLFSFTFLFN